jgi:hypothetical protein
VDYLRKSVDNTRARLWKRHFSAHAGAIRLLAIPGELASGGVISRRRSLGIFLMASRRIDRDAEPLFITDALSMTC